MPLKNPLDDYLQRACLLHMVNASVRQSVAGHLNALLKRIDGGGPTLAEDQLYLYRVPLLSPDDSCAIGEALDPKPYDLGTALGGRSYSTTRRLAVLNALVRQTVDATGTVSVCNRPVDWLGIYQSRARPDGSKVLIKLAYQGIPSRAEFPLTWEFATQSNNSTVGLCGQAKIINDVRAYRGPYYACDTSVEAEACLPLFAAASGEVVGIIDAEARHKDFFTDTVLAPLLALGLLVPEWLP